MPRFLAQAIQLKYSAHIESNSEVLWYTSSGQSIFSKLVQCLLYLKIRQLDLRAGNQAEFFSIYWAVLDVAK